MRISALAPFPLAPLAVAVLAAALAGCGKASPAGSGPASTRSSGPATAAAPVSAAASTAAPSPGAVAADSITPDRLCALVPVKDAAAATHTSPAITQQQSGTFANGEPECGYASADQSLVINVTIFNPAKTKFDLTHGAVSDSALTPVSGLGRSAAYGSPELDVLFGSRALVVESFGSANASKEQLVALAKTVLSRLS